MKKKNKTVLYSFLGGILGGLLSMLIIVAFAEVSQKGFAFNNTVDEEIIVSEKPAEEVVSATKNLPVMADDFTEAAEKTVNSVVHIKTEMQLRTQLYDDYWNPFWEFFGGGPSQPVIATGSGVIISDDGYIVTNNHVVHAANKISVTLNDKKSYEAKIIGKDPATDIALIKIEEENLPFLSFSNSDDVRIGEWVLAVGNPFNLTSTVTAGIVSAKARNINILGGGSSIESFIQTDAAVNQGNSGGALVNTKGELIGINAAIASKTGYYTGYSFAIPSNIVKKITDDIKEHGTVQRAYLGLTMADIDNDLAEKIGLDIIKGVYVAKVIEGGASEEAGVKEGDVIYSIDDFEITSSSRLQEVVGLYSPGDKAKIGILRDNKEKSINLIFKNQYGSTEMLTRIGSKEVSEVLGAAFMPVNEQLKKQLKLDSGIEVVELKEGKLKSAGVKEGFVIVSVNEQKINNLEDFFEALRLPKGANVLFKGYYANGMMAYYGFNL
jgi:Do/DeqQ family serine protease